MDGVKRREGEWPDLAPETGEDERPHGRRLIEGLALAAIVAFYLITTLPNIGNNPIAGGDEGWIISGSAKLAEQGTFGTDLFAGFFSAESRYYFNLPLHHLMLAGVFKVFGAGMTQARLVSAAFGLAALALTYVLGRRFGGSLAGLGAAALLVLLRLNLTPFTGLTLTDLGATVRYDLIALPFALAAALVLLRREALSARDAGAAGLLLGLGCLTQFIDSLFVLPFALFIFGAPVARSRKLLLYAVMACCLPAALPALLRLHSRRLARLPGPGPYEPAEDGFPLAVLLHRQHARRTGPL